MLAQAGGDLGRVEGVGEEELDSLEAGGPRGGEALEERVLLEHHAEVGGEARHRSSSLPSGPWPTGSL